jgi:hypothetical protein
MFKVETFYITDYTAFAEEFQQYINMQADKGWMFQSGLIVLDNVIYCAYKHMDTITQLALKEAKATAEEYANTFAYALKKKLNEGENNG